MKDKICIATFSENAVEVIARYGLGIELNDICISEALDADQEENTIRAMRKEISDSQAKNVIMHGPFTEIIPASIDHRAVELGLTRLNEAYRMCEKLGVNRMVVHSGYQPLLYFKEWHHEKSLYFWKKFLEDKSEDFTIYIENVFEDEPYMMKQLLEELDDPRARICLDVGHANVCTLPEYDIFDWLSVLGPYIGHFHLHNNDGTSDSHGPVHQGAMDMKKVLQEIARHCGQDVTMTIESRQCAESAAWLRQYFRA